MRRLYLPNEGLPNYDHEHIDYQPGATIYYEIAFLNSQWEKNNAQPDTWYNIGDDDVIVQLDYTTPDCDDLVAWLSGQAVIQNSVAENRINLKIKQVLPSPVDISSCVKFWDKGAANEWQTMGCIIHPLALSADTTYRFRLQCQVQNGYSVADLSAYHTHLYTYMCLKVERKP